MASPGGIENLEGKMFDAVEKESLESFKAIVLNPALNDEQRKILLNSEDHEGWGALQFAAGFGKTEIAAWLLSDEGRAAGFDSVLAKAKDGCNALQNAADFGHLGGFQGILNGCRDDERHEMLNAADNDGRTVLHTAATIKSADIATWLLSEEGRAAGFDSVLAKMKDGSTALHDCAQYGQLEGLRAIVNGCQVDNGERYQMLNAVNNVGWTALHLAARESKTETITWLLSLEGGRAAGFDSVLAKSKDESTALHLAAEQRHLASCKAIVNGCRVDNGERREMLNAADKEGWTVLHQAAFYGKAAIITWLLSDEEEGGQSADFNGILARTLDGSTALHLAAQRAPVEAFEAIVNGCRVDNGERQEVLNAVDNDGYTVLHSAAMYEKAETITWILTEGVEAGFDRKNITALSKTGLSALHLASKGSPDCVQALLSHCTSEERMNLFLSVDKHGWTSLHRAAQKEGSSMVSELLQHPECSLIANWKDNLGMTVLHRAIIGGIDAESRNAWRWYYFTPNPSIIRALLRHNPSPSSITATAIDPNIGLGSPC